MFLKLEIIDPQGLPSRLLNLATDIALKLNRKLVLGEVRPDPVNISVDLDGSTFKWGYGVGMRMIFVHMNESNEEINRKTIWIYKKYKEKENFLWDYEGETDSTPEDLADHILNHLVEWLTTT